ncbi:lantibiotic dehydratase [Parachitinimonas caeni]|uniref:Lantibiotic dehydratase n=1 Tax=Parachitinimonas caeni TaxID=3031301 RepID=A0ABT7DZ46_9NEIS|nr:lantibiotic dehydratase [Parachitinimonas caeni]MDK2125323.1 lantibiotic dehydratase [Parachitinimonas caeni]
MQAKFVSDFIFVRTPLLPVSAYTTIGSDACEHTEHLRQIFSQPKVREALFTYSPTLYESISGFLDEGAELGVKEGRTLTNILARLTLRTTPFGLFAGGTLGEIGSANQIQIAQQAFNPRFSRADFEIAYQQCQTSQQIEATRTRLHANPTALKVNDTVQYIERQLHGGKFSYIKSQVDDSLYLQYVLNVCRQQPGYPPALIAGLRELDAEIETDEAADFISELIHNQLLLADTEPRLTQPPLTHSLWSPTSHPDSTAQRTQIDAWLVQADRQAAAQTSSLDIYRQLVSSVLDQGLSKDASKILNIISTPTADRCEISFAVVEEVQAAAGVLLTRFGVPSDPLRSFREAFSKRYERRAVPLLQAIDEEIGLGRSLFIATSPDSHLANDRKQQFESWWRDRQPSPSEQGVGIALSDSDLERFSAIPAEKIQGALHALVVLEQAPDAPGSPPRILLKSCGSNNPATVVGRFTAADATLHQRLQAMLAHEQAQYDGAILAELRHVPQPRFANFISRPTLREFSISPFADHTDGQGTAIALDDLWLAVINERVVLFSRTLDKEVVPRLDCAHNVSTDKFKLYKFLASLASQGDVHVHKPWVDHARLHGHCPRITYRNTVLALARWHLFGEETRELKQAQKAGTLETVMPLLAQRRQLPRHFILEVSDHWLTVDLKSPASIEAFVDELRSGRSYDLLELFPSDFAYDSRLGDEPCAHEIVIPMLHQTTGRAWGQHNQTFRQALTTATLPRFKAPGSDWLYLKVYCGESLANEVLGKIVATLPAWAQRHAVPDLSWFFIRYRDPDFHLRIRFRLTQADWLPMLMQTLHITLCPMLEAGLVSDMQYATYWPEIERYGGADSLELCEQHFCNESQLAQELLTLELTPDQQMVVAASRIHHAIQQYLPEQATQDRYLAKHSRTHNRVGRVSRREIEAGDLFRQINPTLWDFHQNQPVSPLLEQARQLLNRHKPAYENFWRALSQIHPADSDLSFGLLDSLIHMFCNRYLSGNSQIREYCARSICARLFRREQSHRKPSTRKKKIIEKIDSALRETA